METINKIHHPRSIIHDPFDKGFTLIELLVVTAIILVIIGVISNLFFSSLRGSTRTTLLNEAKQNGDYALSTMERMIRGSVKLVTACSSTPVSLTEITIKNSDGGETTFVCPTSPEVRIASNSATTVGYLTSSRVAVINCSFSCVKSGSTSSAMVKIIFSVTQGLVTPAVTFRPEENVSLKYETSVIIRNTAF